MTASIDGGWGLLMSAVQPVGPAGLDLVGVGYGVRPEVARCCLPTTLMSLTCIISRL
jgi:hypothetical protein